MWSGHISEKLRDNIKYSTKKIQEIATGKQSYFVGKISQKNRS